jgi:hypothetical protein
VKGEAEWPHDDVKSSLCVTTGYEPEFTALKKELNDFIERIPGVRQGDPDPRYAPRGHRGVPIEFSEDDGRRRGGDR